MFFNGFPQKGVCSGGGAHEAMGLTFVLPHDVPETKTAQHNWRFCHKCENMYFDGFPQKGRCAAGGGHEAAGFNFTLPHDIPDTQKSQRNWRFCSKCDSLFFDGFADKGKCAQGGGHTAAGFNFVLPNLGDPLANGLETMWEKVGRAVVSDQIRQSINGHEFQKGWSGHDAEVNLAALSSGWRRTGPAAMSLDLRLPGSNVKFHTTQPSVLGSFADPEFRVGFDMLMRLDCAARANAPFFTVNVVDASVSHASVHGSNATGTIVETVADFISRGDFTRQVTSRVNNTNLKSQMQNGINNALAGIPNFVLPG
jgi:hypothetical protein